MDETKRVIIPTNDGSHTVLISDSGITYHSTHGALQESLLVYLQYGLDAALNQYPAEDLAVFEMGFGTGLNAFLTVLKSQKLKTSIQYTCAELYPLSLEEAHVLNYANTENERTIFQHLHQSIWGGPVQITDYFTLTKLKNNLLDIELPQQFHLIYFDAFSPTEQPELWTEEVFKKMFDALLPGGILTTYCSKSIVRKALQRAGFMVSKLPGPRGKRDVLQASKPL